MEPMCSHTARGAACQLEAGAILVLRILPKQYVRTAAAQMPPSLPRAAIAPRNCRPGRQARARLGMATCNHLLEP